MKLTLEQILDSLKEEASVEYQEAAKSFGISVNENKIKTTMIADSEDIYALIDNLYADQIFRSFNYLALLSTGWAAPIDENNENNLAPSQHKERRRVSLVICADVNDQKLLGSAIVFHDDIDNPVFDYGSATGILADSFMNLFS